MSKKMLIDATHPEETRVVVVEGNKVDEFDFESLNKRQLAGNIYLAKVTRVEPSLQAAFIDYGGNRHGFLAFNEIHPDYYQIPVADRERLLAEEAEYAKAKAEEDAKRAEQPKRGRRRKKKPVEAEAQGAASKDDAVITSDIVDDAVIDIDSSEPELVDVPESQAADDTAPSAPVVEQVTEKTETDTSKDAKEDDTDEALDTPEKPGIITVADDDVSEEVRPRKPRMKRYKIQEVVKVRQILLVQVVKEERGNKGAALTTYLSLAGRYCVLMPNTARGGGISRKITNAVDRKKIKAIANKLVVPEGAGLIIRTAGAQRNEADINRDYEFLSRQWEQIRDLTLKSIAPAPIYEEGNLIKRSIRDLYTSDIDEIHVEGDAGYAAAKEYMEMFMPNRVDKVQHYQEPMPLFSRYQVESHLGAMFNPTVQLKSGGYLVIGITEALVAVDVNSGKATKESSIEKTALKTNLEAAEEVARQMRLRDLAGLIVIDFIDMDERRNNTAVEKRLKDKLKTDRARIQIGRISGFGLLEMSRQRLRPGMLEATTQPCPHCHATGLLRSDDSLALSILRELEEEGVRKRSGEVLVKAPINVTNYLLNEKREHITTIEARYGMSVRIEADVSLIGTDYSVEKFKTATRFVPQPANAPVSMETVSMESFDEAVSEAKPTVQPTETPTDGHEERPKKRRRRRGGRGRNKSKQANNDTNNDTVQNDAISDAPKEADQPSDTSDKATDTAVKDAPEPEAPKQEAAEPETAKVEKPKRKRAPRKTAAQKAEEKAAAEVADQDSPSDAVTEAKEEKKKPAKKAAPKAKAKAKAKAKPKAATKKPAPEPEAVVVEAVAELPETPQPEATPEPEAEVMVAEKPKPKRRGWWSRG
ncbi:MAG: ribonuclease E/G [Amylibacter sp.]|nr:ribonuclease E/G [Amylibacter sp.]